ncbi:TetR/AcrR family transcriptional regulator [Micromonospora zhanjiangensis]
MRADARRNRARLLEVADEVFAERGTGASTEEIARAAGVGIGTVFRHFPTKEALLEAVLVARLHRIAADAQALRDADDPGGAFFGFLTGMVETAATKTAYTDALAAAGIDVGDAIAPVRAELRSALGELLDRAQRAGAVRTDIGLPELFALLVGMSRAAEHTPDRTVQARTLAVLLDGLRA